MDLTGLFALLFAGIVGFVIALTFAIRRGRSYARLSASILSLSVIADFALLVDWSRSDKITTQFLLSDAILFAMTGLIGGAVGAAPVLLCYWVYQAAKRRDEG